MDMAVRTDPFFAFGQYPCGQGIFHPTIEIPPGRSISELWEHHNSILSRGVPGISQRAVSGAAGGMGAHIQIDDGSDSLLIGNARLLGFPFKKGDTASAQIDGDLCGFLHLQKVGNPFADLNGLIGVFDFFPHSIFCLCASIRHQRFGSYRFVA